MVGVAAKAACPLVLMHWRQHSAVMQDKDHTTYDDLIADIISELMEQVEAALAAGVDRNHIIIDPGLGFSKTGDQNWTVLAHLDAFTDARLSRARGGESQTIPRRAARRRR